jgi:hypothetical protein
MPEREGRARHQPCRTRSVTASSQTGPPSFAFLRLKPVTDRQGKVGARSQSAARTYRCAGRARPNRGTPERFPDRNRLGQASAVVVSTRLAPAACPRRPGARQSRLAPCPRHEALAIPVSLAERFHDGLGADVAGRPSLLSRLAVVGSADFHASEPETGSAPWAVRDHLGECCHRDGAGPILRPRSRDPEVRFR